VLTNFHEHRGFKRGYHLSFLYDSPYLLRERGIQGVRMTTNLNIQAIIDNG